MKSAQMLVEEKIKEKKLEDKNIENMLMFASWAYFERYQPWNASQTA